MKKNIHALESALHAWEAGSMFRISRDLLKRHTFGSGMIPDGESTPVSMNMLRRLVRILVGRFRSEVASSELYKGDMAGISRLNSLVELDARELEEFIISGCAVQRVVDECRPEGAGVWINNVDPRRFFVNRFDDPRGNDIELVGMFHDMSWPQFVNRFGGSSAARADSLRKVFSESRSSIFADDAQDLWPDVRSPLEAGESKIRMTELWTLDAVPHQSRRYKYDMVWRCRWLAPDGTELRTARSPFAHGSHPYVVKFYPLIDGEIHSFIEDLVERQCSVNRLLSSFEATIAASAKGALLFPVEQLVKGFTYDDIGALWARPDSIIPITGRGPCEPKQITVNSASTGIVPIVEMQLRLFEETSGVSDTLKGKALSGSVGTEMYKALTANADSAIADVLDTFRSFLAERNRKALLTLTPNSSGISTCR